jgi:two-component system, NtrC family, sensor kinase
LPPNDCVQLIQHCLKETSHHPAMQVPRSDDLSPKLECYVGQLNQVMMNLLLNGIDAIETQWEQEQNFVPMTTIKTVIVIDERVIQISDNGIGISEAIQPYIFDPFSRQNQSARSQRWVSP